MNIQKQLNQRAMNKEITIDYDYEVSFLATPIEPRKFRVKLEDVIQLYTGKGNVCRCGCAGDYVTLAENPKRIKTALKRLASGNYKTTYIDNSVCNELIVEMTISEETDRVWTLYVKKK